MYENIHLYSSTEEWCDSNFLINLLFVSVNACRIATHIYMYMFLSVVYMCIYVCIETLIHGEMWIILRAWGI